MPITLRQLDIFHKVAISGHVTKASEQLLLSQSAVSMSIAEWKNLPVHLFLNDVAEAFA